MAQIFARRRLPAAGPAAFRRFFAAGGFIITSDSRGAAEVLRRQAIDAMGADEARASLIANALTAGEFISRSQFDQRPAAEFGFQVRPAAVGSAEFGSGVSADTVARIENLGAFMIAVDSQAALEFTSMVVRALSASAEATSRFALENTAQSEIVSLSVIAVDGVASLEVLFTSRTMVPGAAIEELASLMPAGIAHAEVLGQSALIINGSGTIELLGRLMRSERPLAEFGAAFTAPLAGLVEGGTGYRFQTAANTEALSSLVRSSLAGLEYVARQATDLSGKIESGAIISGEVAAQAEASAVFRISSRAFAELIAVILNDASAKMEWSFSLQVSFDLLGLLEISGMSVGTDSIFATLESGRVLRIDPRGSSENQAWVTIGPRALLEEGAIVVSAQLDSLSIGRVRILTAPYTTLQLPPFDPLRVGELDNFAFDFTPDVGSATITSTSWICSMAPGDEGADIVPQARVITSVALATIYSRSPVGRTIQPWNGAFSVALIGPFPEMSIGATYVLEATVHLSDGRILKSSSTVLCVDG